MKKLIFLYLISIFSFELHAQKELIVFSENSELFLANLNSDNLAKKVSNFFEFTNVNFETAVLEITLDNNQKLKKSILLKENTTIYSISNLSGSYKIEYRGNYNLDEELPQFEFTKNIINNPGVTIDYSLVPVGIVELEDEQEGEEPVDTEATAEEVVEESKVNNIEEPVELEVAVVKEVEKVEEEEIDRAPNKLVNINIILDSIEGITDDKKRTTIIVKELNKGKYNCRQLKFLFTKIKTDYSKLYTFKSTVNSCLDKGNLLTLKPSFKTKKYRTEFVKLVSRL